MCCEFSADSNPDWQQGTTNKSIEGLTLSSSDLLQEAAGLSRGSPPHTRPPLLGFFFPISMIFMRQHMESVASSSPCAASSLDSVGLVVVAHRPTSNIRVYLENTAKVNFTSCGTFGKKKKKETLQITSSTHVLSHQHLLLVPQGCLCVMSSNPGSCFAILSERLL